MATHEFFLILLAILLSARVLAELASRFGVPPVIGELLAGVLLGPSLLGWISPGETLKLLAEIGIILLLFQVGLETDARRLAKAGRSALIVAVAGFLVPFATAFFLSNGLFGLPMLGSLFVAGTLTATSIGITVRVLADLQRADSPESQIVLGAAVLDDVLGVLLLALLYEFSIGGGVNLVNASKVALFIGAFFLLAPIAAKLMSLVIRRFDQSSQIPGLLPTTIVALVLFFAWLSHEIGAPEILGGFAAGLALSRRFFLPFGIALHTDSAFAHRIEQQMAPVVQLFPPIFFVMVGLSLNLQEIDWGSLQIWLLSLSLFVIATVGKLAGALLIPQPFLQRLIVGIAMVPRGEVGLIFAELGRTSGIIDNLTYAALLIVIALTTLLPPFALRYLCRRLACQVDAAADPSAP